jgi:flagellar protein FlaG
VEVAPVPETEIVYAPATTVALPVGEEAELARAVQRSEVKLERAVAELNQSLASYARHMSISMHQATGRAMVTVYNTDTREIIREIPPEKVLDAHASLMEIAGLFVDTRG